MAGLGRNSQTPFGGKNVANPKNDSKEDPSRPGPIDNNHLLDDDEDNELDTAMGEGTDFDFIEKNIWEVLHAWYGGGPALPRTVLQVGHELKIEVHRLKLIFVTDTTDDDDDGYVAYFSKADSVNTIHRAVCDQLDKPYDDVRLWDYYQNYKQKVLNEPDATLDEAGLLDDQKVLVEVKKDGKFPESARATTISYPSTYTSNVRTGSYYGSGYSTGYSGYSGYSGYGYSNYTPNYPPADKPGLVGLSNLGNTCFMNSSIQCLSNTVPLANAFIRDQYKDDINADNPLGTGGQLANEWAKLMREIWTGKTNVVAPRDFKYRLGKFAPQFEGYQQHDSQELMSFLLDGIHEDLNRIKKKPFMEVPDSAGRPDEEVAKEHWTVHVARNDSIIVDWFHGQIRSKLICPTCERVSVTFDPIMFMSLPIPVPTHKTLPVTVVFLDPTKLPTKVQFKLPKQATCLDLYAECGKYFNLPPAFAATDLFGSKFYKRFAPDWGIVDNFQASRDAIWLYQLAPPSAEGEPVVVNMPVYMRRTEPSSYSYVRSTLFGHPFYQPVPVSSTPEELYASLVARLARFIEPESEAESEEVKSAPVDSLESPSPLADSGALADSGSVDPLADSGSVGVPRQNSPDNSSSSFDDSEKPLSDSSEEVAPARTLFQGKLFNILFCDPYGNTLSQQPILEPGKPISFPKDSNLILDWTAYGLEHYNQVRQPILRHQREEKAYDTDSSINLEDDEAVTTCSIEKCLQLFTESETLGEEDAWYCSSCKEHKLADKKLDLWQLPKILIVHLKRFSYKGKYMFREKLDTHVDTPLKGLDLRKFLLKPDDGAIYDLYAVSNHYGALGGGHYTASAINKVTGQWYKFDDSSVSPISEENVITTAAYVLYYRRRDSIDPAGIDAPDILVSEEAPTSNNQASYANRPAASSSDSSEDNDLNVVRARVRAATSTESDDGAESSD